MTLELQSTLEVSVIQWSALRNNIPCMAHVIQLVLGAFLRSLGVKGHIKSLEAHECNQQFGENEGINIGKSQRLRKESNARIDQVTAMKPGFANIMKKVRISWYFANPEFDLHIAENACWIDYADTWASKRVHRHSKTESLLRSSTDYGREDMWELNTAVAQVGIPITAIHTRVSPKSTILWLPAPFHNSRWVDSCEVCHGSIEAILILDPVDVEEAYSYISSCDHSVQWHVQSYGWREVSFG